MTRLSLLLAGLALAPSVRAQATVRVENPTGAARPEEVVSVRWETVARRTPGLTMERVRALDAAGAEVPVQAFDADGDGTPDALLLLVSLGADETQDVRIEATPAQPVAPLAHAYHDARRDDVAWENDRVVFRTYGLGLYALEDLTSSGIDAWTKRTDALVIDRWYADGHYHRDDGEGADFFSVGPTLGAGGTAVWADGALWRTPNFAGYRLLADGPLRAVVETTSAPFDAAGRTVTETRRITIDAGQPSFRLESTMSATGTEALRVATGVVDRPALVATTGGAGGWTWQSTWGPLDPAKPDRGALGAAVLTRADRLAETLYTDNHSLLVVDPPKNDALVTHVVTAWTRAGTVDSQQAFDALVVREAERLATPLRASVVAAPLDARAALDAAAARLRPFLARQAVDGQIPRSLEPDGTLNGVPHRDWTSGFYAGTLWDLYDDTRDDAFADAARRWTALVEPEKTNGRTHDMGFKIMPSVGAAFRLTEDPAYRAVLVEAADTLLTRFDPRVGAVRSWDWGTWRFPVIIDNMMNLELLYDATDITGNPAYAAAATQHARTTLAHHFRADASSFHVVDYDDVTGAVRDRGTWQGVSDSSAWSRGQGWALYGFTMAYRESGEAAFLAQARRVADYVLPRLPGDGVPPWDFDAPDLADAPRDASAAAVIASGLIELAGFVPDERARYLAAADHILASLAQDYLAPASLSEPFILDHSTGSVPGGTEVDVPLIYADYYYVEALLRRLRDAPTAPAASR